MSDDDDLPVVHVRVLVNVDDLRRGDEGEVPLTPRIQRLVASGYMAILGHVLPPAPVPPPTPVANPRRVRHKAVTDGAAGPDQA